jgi:hypothetical protein
MPGEGRITLLQASDALLAISGASIKQKAAICFDIVLLHAYRDCTAHLQLFFTQHSQPVERNHFERTAVKALAGSYEYQATYKLYCKL